MTTRKIIAAVAAHYHMMPANITGPRKTARIAFARSIAMYLCREMLAMSFPAIGFEFKRDHTTAIYGIRRIRESDVYRAQAETIRALLGAGPAKNFESDTYACQDCKHHAKHMRVIVRELAALVRHMDERDEAESGKGAA